MRSMVTAALSVVLLFGCGDDSDDDTGSNDASVKSDAGSRDAGSVDASLDASRQDASVGGRASALLVSKSNSSVTGNAIFEVRDGVVTLSVKVNGATAGKHGIHIHVNGDCSAPDASSAGGHWDPAATMHHGSGALDAGAGHLGDLGNITIGADGSGTLTLSKPAWTLGDGASTDIVNHAIVVHANEDDLSTQTGDAGPGNSGGRLACGVINAL